MRPIFDKLTVDPKKWGCEKVIVNNDQFCGKILEFNKVGNKCSNHYHKDKRESFLILNRFKFIYIDTETAIKHEIELGPGDVVHIPPGSPHQMIALEDKAQIFEVSSHHENSDSYRIEPGDSQA